jgi:hypothetical protein
MASAGRPRGILPRFSAAHPLRIRLIAARVVARMVEGLLRIAARVEYDIIQGIEAVEW